MDISAFASGFLDLLGVRRGGRALNTAADFLSPVIECGALYRLARRIPQQATLPFVAGKNTFFTVPVGKVWHVPMGYIAITTAAGETTQGTHAYVEPSNLQGNVIALTNSVDAVASQIKSVCFEFSNMYFGPGDKFGVATGSKVGAPTAYMSLIVEEFSAA